MAEDETIVGTVEETASRTVPEEAAGPGQGGDRWLCVMCHQPVAREGDRFTFFGASEHSFVNPSGIRFHILLFGQVSGCLNVGTPTLQHTWFPGCAWSYCLCGSCRSHLGWFYTGLNSFVALIRERIVRASLVHN
ncbi:MAG: cereblon family protein [Verrucomicrobiae bacterium]|nr:cereblon family protein [Verrucomicrobiae bacterium]